MSSSRGLLAPGRLVSPDAAVDPGTAQPSPSGFIHPKVAQGIYAVLTELGADPDALITKVGLDPQLFDSGSKLFPFAGLGRLMAVGAERTRCPHLGLLVGQRATLASLGLVGLLMRTAETIGHALRALEAHRDIHNRDAVVGLGVYGATAVLSYASYEPEAEGAGLHAERALATATKLLRALGETHWAPLEVLLPRSAPRNITLYQSFFRAPLRFDQDMAALVFPAELLEQRVAGANPALHRRVEARIRRLETLQAHTLTDEMRHYLFAEATRQRCKAKRVARLRLVDRRTLSRRLQAEGTTFKRLYTEVQFGVAKQLLADTTMSMAQISAALDFSEQAALTHAFRRWSGVTPSAWRQRNRRETAANTTEVRVRQGETSDAARGSGLRLCPS